MIQVLHQFQQLHLLLLIAIQIFSQLVQHVISCLPYGQASTDQDEHMRDNNQQLNCCLLVHLSHMQLSNNPTYLSFVEFNLHIYMKVLNNCISKKKLKPLCDNNVLNHHYSMEIPWHLALLTGVVQTQSFLSLWIPKTSCFSKQLLFRIKHMHTTSWSVCHTHESILLYFWNKVP